MLLLVEAAAGHALFKVKDPKRVTKDSDSLWEAFETPESAGELVKLKAFHKFEDVRLRCCC